jgi:hypothetical protein
MGLHHSKPAQRRRTKDGTIDAKQINDSVHVMMEHSKQISCDAGYIPRAPHPLRVLRTTIIEEEEQEQPVVMEAATTATIITSIDLKTLSMKLPPVQHMAAPPRPILMTAKAC